MELLGQGSTIEQISKIAKNLLSMSSNGAAGNSELFSAVSKVIGGGPVDAGSKLTSSAVLHPEAKVAILKPISAQESGIPTIINGTSVAQIQTLFSSLNGTNPISNLEASLSKAPNS